MKYSLKFFRNSDEAKTYRHQYGTGGWIFSPESGDCILFPPDLTPTNIFNHVATKGRTGELIGSQ